MISDIVEDLLGDISSLVLRAGVCDPIEAASRKTKIAALPLAIAARLAHDHPPCTTTVPGCAYCQRHGNYFAQFRQRASADG